MKVIAYSFNQQHIPMSKEVNFVNAKISVGRLPVIILCSVEYKQKQIGIRTSNNTKIFNDSKWKQNLNIPSVSVSRLLNNPTSDAIDPAIGSKVRDNTDPSTHTIDSHKHCF